MRKDYTINQEQCDLSDQTGCSVTRGATGRTTNYQSPEHHCQEALVRQWTEVENRDALLMHPTAEIFGSIINETPVIKGTPLVCYRGCYRRQDMIPCPLPHHFGPPPPENAKSDRYNFAGKPVLYLCTTKFGIAYEKQKDSNLVKENLFCQEYLLDPADLRLADFTNPTLNNFIQIVLDYEEYGIRGGKINRDEYLLSQTVAAIVEGKGFSGMLVPGVRGNPEHRYQNIIIFNPEAIWKKIVNMDIEPECIDGILSN